jgi:DNA-binding Lrp family transcriptional regulator
MAKQPSVGKKPILSEIDKQILKVLLNPNGRITSEKLAKQLGIPRTTVQRRRGILEKRFLQFEYTLKLEELGFRRVDFLISTENGMSVSVGQELLKREEVVYVGRSVGEHTIDLRAELIIKDNSELLDLLEAVKAMPGVREVEWTEIVKVLGRKRSIPSEIIDKM